MGSREEKILVTIKEFANKLPKFPDGRIDYSNSDIAPVITVFIKHKDKILSKEQIISHVWDYDADILENTVEVYIGYLRNKIDRPFPKKSPLIQTIRGFGYKIGK